jgi:hypothetical protein
VFRMTKRTLGPGEIVVAKYASPKRNHEWKVI